MRIVNLLFILIGIIFMTIGMVGVVIPVLPTTPFLLLASVFFVKGSDRFDQWFRDTKLYKNYAEDFINDRSMTIERKIKLMVLSDFMLSFPLFKLDGYIRIFIVAVIIFKYYYFIFKIKTKKE